VRLDHLLSREAHALLVVPLRGDAKSAPRPALRSPNAPTAYRLFSAQRSVIGVQLSASMR
jgi:hypothetical protein